MTRKRTHPSPKTYATKLPGGRTVRCTVPESPAVAYEGDAEEVLRDVLRDSFGPETIALVAKAIQVQLRTTDIDPEARRQGQYLADLLVSMLGGQKGYRAALRDAID